MGADIWLFLNISAAVQRAGNCLELLRRELFIAKITFHFLDALSRKSATTAAPAAGASKTAVITNISNIASTSYFTLSLILLPVMLIV